MEHSGDGRDTRSRGGQKTVRTSSIARRRRNSSENRAIGKFWTLIDGFG
jgi:hypothetical protein